MTVDELEDMLVRIGRRMKHDGATDEELDAFLDRSLSGDKITLLLVCKTEVRKIINRFEDVDFSKFFTAGGK